MVHVFSVSKAVDMLVFDSTTRYTKHPWRHPRGKRRKKVTVITDASTRQKKETTKKRKKRCLLFSWLVFFPVFPRGKYPDKGGGDKTRGYGVYLGKAWDRSQQWWESGTCLIRRGEFLRLQGGGQAAGRGRSCVFVRSQAHEFKLCGEITAMRWLLCLRQRCFKKKKENKRYRMMARVCVMRFQIIARHTTLESRCSHKSFWTAVVWLGEWRRVERVCFGCLLCQLCDASAMSSTANHFFFFFRIIW